MRTPSAYTPPDCDLPDPATLLFVDVYTVKLKIVYININFTDQMEN